MCDKENCNCGSNPCCGDCEPWNCVEQAVNDVWATKETQIEGLVDRAETAAESSEASAKASADSAAEAKEFRDEAETAATTAVAAEGVVLGVANTLQDTADKLKQIADELGTAIAGISVVTWHYTTVEDNQTIIPVPDQQNEVDVQAIFIEGARQEPGRGFVYDKLKREISLAEPLPIGMEISIIIGVYSDNPNDFSNTLASANGASLVGTTSGKTVQEVLNEQGSALLDMEAEITAQAELNARIYRPAFFIKELGSFGAGGSATSKASVLYNGADGMYYTPKVGRVTVPAGSVPNTDWICVGTLQYQPYGDIRNFKAKPDGTDSANALILAAYYSNFMQLPMIVTNGMVFDSSYVTLKDLDYLEVLGTGTIRAIAGRTGQTDYAGGAQFTLINIQNLDFAGPLLDGYREGSPEYTGFAMGILICTGTGDFRSNSGGDTKPNRNIRIRYPTRFTRQGSYRAGNDKFGDGIYLFGVDGFDIDGVTFTDIGRWGVAGTEVFNGKIRNSTCVNTKANSIALGFVDIETESTDPVYGTSAENIDIYNNDLVGYSQILVGAGNNSENVTGANHHIKNINVYNNRLRIPNGLTHINTNYETNLVYMGVAPFCNVFSQTNLVTNTRVKIYNNVLVHENPNNLAIGIGMNGQGIGSGNGKFNEVSYIEYRDNIVIGFSKPLQVAATSDSTGYTLRNVRVMGNDLNALSSSGSITLRMAATQLVDCLVDSNSAVGSTVRAISIEDGRDIGAIDSTVMVSNNRMNAATSVNLFLYVYNVSMVNNTTLGSATSISSIVTKVDKDYGNTWNRLERTLPALSIPNNTHQAIGNIDVGSSIGFGYSVEIVPMSLIGQVLTQAFISDPGAALYIIHNIAGETITKPSQKYWVTVEKR